MRGTGNFRRFQLLALALVVAMLAGSVAHAQSYDPDQDLPQPTKFQKRLEKMGRGLSNVLFGWAELPLQWHNGVEMQRPLTEILVTDTIKGTTKVFMRMGIGVYEFFTFYWDTADSNYEAVLEPDYLF